MPRKRRGRDLCPSSRTALAARRARRKKAQEKEQASALEFEDVDAPRCDAEKVAEVPRPWALNAIKREVLDVDTETIEESQACHDLNAQGHASDVDADTLDQNQALDTQDNASDVVAEIEQTQPRQTTNTHQQHYLVVKKMPKPVENRIDPTLLLPEEEMSYEIKTKKKKKKKKKNKEDPLRDCIDLEEKAPVVIEYESNAEANGFFLDPDVTIKVEDVELDFHGITAEDDFGNQDNYHEPEISFEDINPNNDAVILTFQKNLKKDYSGVPIEPQDIKTEIMEDDNESDKSYESENDGVACSICHMVFKNRSTLNIHKSRKHNIKQKSFKYICKWCGISYEQKTSLTTHVKRKHINNTNTEDMEDKPCPVCALVFKGSLRLRMHMQRRHGNTPLSFKYRCNVCKLTYERKSSLMTHKKRKHSSKGMPVRKLKCRLCPNIYTNRDTYTRHLQRTHQTGNDTASVMLETLIQRHTTAGDLPCSICPMMFSKPSYLKLHMRRHHAAFKDEYRIKCPHCDLSYDRNESLKRHLLRKHYNNMYCDVCHKNFNTKEEFDGHKHKKPVYECTLCSEIFANQGGLSKHMRCKHKIDSGAKRIKCNLCSESFHENRQLKAHMIRVHLNIKYPCKYCSKIFKTKDSFQNHCTKSHPNNLHATADYNCAACNISFTTERELCSHKLDAHRVPIPKEDNLIKEELETQEDEGNRTKLEETKTEYQDNENHTNSENPTNNETPIEAKEQKHIALEISVIKEEEGKVIVQTGSEPTKSKKPIESKQVRRVLYDCTKCSEQFSNFPLLRQHFDEKHKLQEQTQCQSCGEFLPLKDLDKHTKTKHAVKTTFKCKFCDFETTAKTTLSQHTLRHKNTTSIPCKFQGCKYKSFYQEAMDKHLKKHSELGEKLQCTRCPFQTMNKYILRYHEEEHETGNKRYKCNQCNYATILPANLVQHKFKHSSEKRFKCDSCPFATKYNTSLRFHVRKKHCDLPSAE